MLFNRVLVCPVNIVCRRLAGMCVRFRRVSEEGDDRNGAVVKAVAPL